ncbi:F-box associated domain type 1 [Arabidopsis suecica]|uniref:F-box associated domain type 1 n=1 Tax=Arabidopsis suecica TaxID=45249 RepID=A0A8T2E6C7_ARASU|nr:F-box associated domain type 1 [Arabidopsis suecica]
MIHRDLKSHPAEIVEVTRVLSLSLLLQDTDFGGEEEVSTDIAVWLTNKLSDGVVSFTKYFNVTSPHLPLLQCHGAMVIWLVRDTSLEITKTSWHGVREK